MTTHAQKAIDWIDYSSNLNPDVDNKASHTAQLAQVHATLALAEQQRISNLIALANVADLSDVQVTPLERAGWLALGIEGTGEPRPEIAAALGIEQDS